MPKNHKKTNKKVILIGDDEKHFTRLLKDNLSDEGYEVNIAMDGDETLKMYYDIKPDVLILDVEMPKLNGYRVCERLFNDSKLTHKPVILMVSAYVEPEDIKKGLRLGATKYITKPFHINELIRAIEETTSEPS